MDKWQELDANNLPSDILVKDAWKREYKTSIGEWATDTLAHISKHIDYRIRRPEGWEPNECPTCGSGAKRAFTSPCYSTLKHDPWHDEPNECPTCGSPNKNNHRIKYKETGEWTDQKYTGGYHYRCCNQWHDEPKPPTHEEIMKPRFWQMDKPDYWRTIVGCRKILGCKTLYLMNDAWCNPEYFINRQSADIPPEGK